MDERQPLWMPRGSVRAILALMTVAIVEGVLAYLALKGSQEALVALVGNLGLVIGFYFGSRTGKEQPEEGAPPAPPPPAPPPGP